MKKWILIPSLLLILAGCEKENRVCPGATEKQFALTGFNRIIAGENFHVTVSKGASYSIKATGCTDDLNDLTLDVTTGNTLEIKFARHKSDRYRVDFVITLPTLTALHLGGNARGTIQGYAGEPHTIRNVLSGNAQCTMNGTAINAQIELSGTSTLNLFGNTLSLYGNISGNAQLNSYDVNATEVDISASGSGKAFVKPIQSIFAEATGESRVYYRGNPPTTHFVTSGNGRIIQQ